MCIDQADADPVELVLVDKGEHFVIGCSSRTRQILQRSQYMGSLSEAAQREFTQDEGMHEDFGPMEVIRQGLVAALQMIHPDRGIDQDHVTAFI